MAITQSNNFDLYQEILTEITEGRFSAGSKIVEAKLGEKYGLSRTPIREALFRLEQEGFVISIPNKGFTITPLSLDEVQEIYPMIWALETLALRLTGVIALTSIDELKKINAELLKAKNSPKKALKLDAQWHDQLLTHCPSKRLLNVLSSLKQKMKRFDFQYMQDSGLVPISVKQHSKIIKALEKEDFDGACRFLEENWRIGLSWLSQCLR